MVVDELEQGGERQLLQGTRTPPLHRSKLALREERATTSRVAEESKKWWWGCTPAEPEARRESV